MLNWIKKIFKKEKVEVPYRTQDEDEEQREIKEFLILSDSSWFGDVARKHHG